MNKWWRRGRTSTIAWAIALGTLSGSATAQTPEQRTHDYFESIRYDPPRLIAFLRAMPKGGDLHTHLGGTTYAERRIEWAAEDGSCVSRRELVIVPAPCAPTPDTVPAADVLMNPELHGALVDALSMRNWHPANISGHDQFFATFDRFRPAPHRQADMLAEAQARAADGHVLYLELMHTAGGVAAWDLAARAGWRDDFGAMRDTLLALGLVDLVEEARAEMDAMEARRDSLLACNTPDADKGCNVTVRYLFQVLRARPPEQIFAHILTGFELASRDPRVVGLNLVQPEDWHLAMRDYSLHMRMIAFIRPLYPDVKVSLHAGELAPGLVSPDGLRFHITEAVEVARAERIGHGVDIMHEEDPYALLAAMAERGILVEINLTSNDVILGVRGRDHPLHVYMDAGVPVALSTDDEGVARSDLSMEHLKAVLEQDLDYLELKRMAFNSIDYAFAEPETKARLRATLERNFAAFEQRFGTDRQ